MILRSRHIPELQVLRGLAAVCVMLCHATNVYQLPRVWRLGFDTLLNAHAAVIFFFVLSGYVLCASLLRQKLTRPAVFSFYVRRLFRIYPAIFAASVLGLFVIELVGSNPVFPTPGGKFLEFMRPSEVNLRTTVLSFAGVESVLIPPVWTILVEILGSLFLPLFMWIVSTRSALAGFFLLLVLTALAFRLSYASHHLSALAYLVYFALGMFIARFPVRVSRHVTGHAGVIALIALTLLLFFRSGWFLALTGRLQPITFDYFAPTPAFVEGLAAAALIAAIVHLSGRFRWVEGRSLAALGDISFSVYLLHFPVMSGLAHLSSPILKSVGASGLVATAAIVIGTFSVTVLLASIMYRFVEKPGIELGRRSMLQMGQQKG